MTETGFVETDFAKIAFAQSRAEGPAILFIHGNSSCKEVFSKQFEAAEFTGYRLIAFDLPGHGASEDASDPNHTYTFGGYAEVAEAVVRQLGLDRPSIFGWSLGGHIALEMLGRGFGAKGLMISGTPPVKADVESLMAGFNIDPNAENLTGKRDFTDADALAYATHTSAVDGHVDPHLLAMCKRTDGRAREIMFGSVMSGKALDEREIVKTNETPLAIVNGRDDVFIRPDYFDGLSYAALWSRRIMRMAGAQHAPFLQRPREFNSLLLEFAKGV
ncbi:alpha/beta fold hydrolase [Mesorhizobium sp. NPDC059054]|uniref:alpha/beta fold hydrolase n=1 Tax=Mesorhizobium sp. NPDC059054 TaxID=3346711 RepID=UPI0036915774